MNVTIKRSIAGVALVLVFLLASGFAAGPQAKSLGLENPNKTMNATVTLNLRNKAELDAIVKQINDKNSVQYHKWLSREEFAARFAPTAADAKAVQDFLRANNLKVIYTDKYNLLVKATGTTADMQRAFHTTVARYQANGQQFSQALTKPSVTGPIASKINSITGFTTLKAHSYAAFPVDPKTRKPEPGIKVQAGKNGVFFPGDCFSKNNTVLTLKGPGLQATYSGNGYPGAGCGYSPAEIQHAYGFDQVYANGYDGTGQTVVIVDPYGSNTILEDANLFSFIYGLPQLVPGVNFNIYHSSGTPDCVVSNTMQCGWETETTLDVEWAHAMAPGATIDLVVAPTAQFSDLAVADLEIAESGIGGSVSHSFGFPEWLLGVYYGDTADIDTQYFINYIAANVFGVSNNYSSGDSGDFSTLGESLVPDVSFPAGSPDATSVGGTSLALTSTGAYKWEEGWGTNETLLNTAPPTNFGFIFGAGGGTSALPTPAPAWQQAFLNNTYRQQPDVALTADPVTAAEVIITPSGVQGDPNKVAERVGGTSWSCPMFSAVWAIAGQKAGTPFLGNAAPTVYLESVLFPGSLNDVIPLGSGHNAHGTVFFGNTPVSYSQWDLAQPYQTSLTFYEALRTSIYSGNSFAITFGTDSSLTTGTGWDNVTGMGTPNGWNFIGPF